MKVFNEKQVFTMLLETVSSGDYSGILIEVVDQNGENHIAAVTDFSLLDSGYSGSMSLIIKCLIR